MISDISEKADYVKFLQQIISYTSLRADEVQYYVQAGLPNHILGYLKPVTNTDLPQALAILKGSGVKDSTTSPLVASTGIEVNTFFFRACPA